MLPGAYFMNPGSVKDAGDPQSLSSKDFEKTPGVRIFWPAIV